VNRLSFNRERIIPFHISILYGVYTIIDGIVFLLSTGYVDSKLAIGLSLRYSTKRKD